MGDAAILCVDRAVAERTHNRHHRPEADPYDGLVRAVWEQTMRDLLAGDLDAYAYVTTDGMIRDALIMLPGADPAILRAVLLDRWWRPPQVA